MSNTSDKKSVKTAQSDVNTALLESGGKSDFTSNSGAELDIPSTEEKVWYSSRKPRVRRKFNRLLVALMMMSLFSFLAMFFVIFANIFLQFIYALYLSWTKLSTVTSFFFTIAAVWLMVYFSFVWITIFRDFWRYCQLTWSNRYDERLREFLWDKLNEGGSANDSQKFSHWWLRSLKENKKEVILCLRARKGTLYRGVYVLCVIVLWVILFFVSIDVDNEGKLKFVTQSGWVSSTMCAFVYLCSMWLWDYYNLFTAVQEHLKIRAEPSLHFEKNWPWLSFWIYSNPLLESSVPKVRVFRVLSEIFLAPVFISYMFYLWNSQYNAYWFSVMIPIVNYILLVLCSFREFLMERDTKYFNKPLEEPEDDDPANKCTLKEVCESFRCDERGGEVRRKCTSWTCKCSRIIVVDFVKRKQKEIFIGSVFFSIAIMYIVLIGVILGDQTQQQPLTMSSSYPACKLTFEFGDDVLGPTEMALFAKWGYMEPSLRYQAMDYVLGSDNYQKRLLNSLNTSRHEHGVQFFHVASNQLSSNITDHFLVIRGTSNTADALQDMKMWTEISSIQIVNSVVPLLTFWPISFTSKLIKALSIMQDWMGGMELMASYLDTVSEYTNSILTPVSEYIENPQQSTDRVMTIGHSLGGGLASLVASREYEPYRGANAPPRVSSFGLSPVGTLYSSMKFGGSWQAVEETATSIFSRRDPVPMVDAQGGLTEKIPCKQKYFFQCHSSLTTICELHRQCRLPVEGKRRAEKENMLNCMCCTATNDGVSPSDYCATFAKNTTYTRSCEVSPKNESGLA